MVTKNHESPKSPSITGACAKRTTAKNPATGAESRAPFAWASETHRFTSGAQSARAVMSVRVDTRTMSAVLRQGIGFVEDDRFSMRGL